MEIQCKYKQTILSYISMGVKKMCIASINKAFSNIQYTHEGNLRAMPSF